MHVRVLNHENEVLRVAIQALRDDRSVDKTGDTVVATQDSVAGEVEKSQSSEDSADVTMQARRAREGRGPVVDDARTAANMLVFQLNDENSRVGKTSNTDNECFAGVVLHGLLRHNDRLWEMVLSLHNDCIVDYLFAPVRVGPAQGAR